MSSAKYKLKDEEVTFLIDNMVTRGYDFVYERIEIFVAKEMKDGTRKIDVLLMDMSEEFVEKARAIMEFDEREHEKVSVTRENKSIPLSDIYFNLAAIMRRMAHSVRANYVKSGKSVLAGDKRFLTLIKKG